MSGCRKTGEVARRLLSLLPGNGKGGHISGSVTGKGIKGYERRSLVSIGGKRKKNKGCRGLEGDRGDAHLGGGVGL